MLAQRSWFDLRILLFSRESPETAGGLYVETVHFEQSTLEGNLRTLAGTKH